MATKGAIVGKVAISLAMIGAVSVLPYLVEKWTNSEDKSSKKEDTAITETVDPVMELTGDEGEGFLALEDTGALPTEEPREITPADFDFEEDVEEIEDDEVDFFVDDKVVEQMLSQMTQEHDGPLFDDGETSRLVIKKATLSVDVISLYTDTPQHELLRTVSDCGARKGLYAEFDQDDIHIQYLGDQRWSVRCQTSYGDFNQENEGSFRVAASVNFVYTRRKELYKGAVYATREHLDGFFRIARKCVTQTGGEWFDYDEHHWVHRICTDQSAASGRFESLGNGLAQNGSFSGLPKSFSFVDKHFLWEGDEVGFKPYTTKVGMADIGRVNRDKEGQLYLYPPLSLSFEMAFE